MSLDYKALGFKAGLEIHQQLDTPKLFCRCPSRLDESNETHVSFGRALTPTMSELGEIDPAVAAEAKRKLVFEYAGNRETCCLVEMDEEPPHAMSPEALAAALEVTFLLECTPVDELHVMRKIVIDGSNTSGFQRTSLLSTKGVVRSEEGDVGIDSLCLEEDSARRLERVGNVQQYRLDRLGIPLVEIATAPELRSPQHAREIAEAIGMALRATGKVKRGIGTIRQDLNVSIAKGARVEIKGVQELRLIAPAVEWEVKRQVHLLEVRDELQRRGATEQDYAQEVVDLSTLFADSKAKLIAGALGRGEGVHGVRLPKLSGLLGIKDKDAEMQPPRVGRELADHAKVRAGVAGIFQSDEMPAYGITQAEADAVAKRLGCAEGDGYALVLADAATAARAMEAVLDRARVLLVSVPEETRDLNLDGTSRYLRPLPGGARMYPETDVPPITLDEAWLKPIRENLPEMPQEKLARFEKDYSDLSQEQAKQLVRGGQAPTFELLVKETGLVKETARLLLTSLSELEAEGFDATRVTDAHLLDVLRSLASGAFAKEAAPKVLRHTVEKGVDANAAVEALGLGAVSHDVVRKEIDALIAKDEDMVARQGMRAAGPLMGPLMGKYRGKVSGKDLSALVAERIEKFMSSRQAED